MNLTCENGPAKFLSIPTPPLASAGKNLSVSRPSARPCSISEGVHTPGTTGILFSLHHFTVSGLSPADTMNCAPAATAFFAISGLITVPAPTTISGHSFVTLLMASSAAAVRNVISATGRPPLIIAFASGTAFSASSILTTGTIPISWKNFMSSAFVIVFLFSF